jgi:hypothetical protein
MYGGFIEYRESEKWGGFIQPNIEKESVLKNPKAKNIIRIKLLLILSNIPYQGGAIIGV